MRVRDRVAALHLTCVALAAWGGLGSMRVHGRRRRPLGRADESGSGSDPDGLRRDSVVRRGAPFRARRCRDDRHRAGGRDGRLCGGDRAGRGRRRVCCGADDGSRGAPRTGASRPRDCRRVRGVCVRGGGVAVAVSRVEEVWPRCRESNERARNEEGEFVLHDHGEGENE